MKLLQPGLRWSFVTWSFIPGFFMAWESQGKLSREQASVYQPLSGFWLCSTHWCPMGQSKSHDQVQSHLKGDTQRHGYGEVWYIGCHYCNTLWASLVAQSVMNPPAVQETWARSLGWGDPLEKEIATQSSILAWEIPWTGKPGGLLSMESQELDMT